MSEMEKSAAGSAASSDAGSTRGEESIAPQDHAELEKATDIIAKRGDSVSGELVYVQASYSGPLPPPLYFQQYDDTLPGAAERLLALLEKEQQTRAAGQAGVIANEKRRINVAAILGVGLLGIIGLAVWLGNPVAAVALGAIGAVAGLGRQLLARFGGGRER